MPNVRRKLASLIVKIRNSIFKEDAEHLDLFDSHVIHLLSDIDSETARIAQEQHQNLKEIDSFSSQEETQDNQKLL